MNYLFLVGMVGLTSGGVYLLGTRVLGLSRCDLPAAVGRMLEAVGLTLIFCMVNLVAALLVLLGGRILLPGFISLYPAGDVGFLLLSSLQGLIFQGWREQWRREAARHGGPAGVRDAAKPS
jgi:hypothetical protein